MQKIKAIIFITQAENDKYFKQTLPTFRNGFCKILRNVTIEQDPYDVYGDGDFGTITVYGRKVTVVKSNLSDWFIS